MKGEKLITMKNGQQALSGICTVCGTKMFKIGGASGKKVAKVKAANRKPTLKTTHPKGKSTQRRK